MRKKYTGDYIGMRFGSLVVIGYPTRRDGKRMAGAICRCDCGNEFSVSSMSSLFKEQRKTCCECSNKKLSEMRKNSAKGPYREFIHERLYTVWRGMKSRCESKSSKSYKNYGAKGVKVCDEWQDYITFRDWAYSHGYDDKAPFGVCTIDRINPFGNYEPSNCRWASTKTQATNKRRDWVRKNGTEGCPA